jgi:hypothetical protein
MRGKENIPGKVPAHVLCTNSLYLLEDPLINTIIDFFNVIHHPVFYFKTIFWRLDSVWTLSPSLGKSILVLAQSVELVPVCSDRN